VPNVKEIWDPTLPGTHWATPGLLGDCFSFYIYIYIYMNLLVIIIIINNKIKLRKANVLLLAYFHMELKRKGLGECG
jgi:hypothetical protein